MTESPKPNLYFIKDTLASIRDNTPSDKRDFMSNPNAKDATLMRLQDIGEQLIRVRDKFPEYYADHNTDEWHKIIGLRNIISHGYREVDFEIIWAIIENHIQDFSKQIKAL